MQDNINDSSDFLQVSQHSKMQAPWNKIIIGMEYHQCYLVDSKIVVKNHLVVNGVFMFIYVCGLLQHYTGLLQATLVFSILHSIHGKHAWLYSYMAFPCGNTYPLGR